MFVMMQSISKIYMKIKTEDLKECWNSKMKVQSAHVHLVFTIFKCLFLIRADNYNV